MDVGIFIQARLGSERLPRKMELPLPENGDKTILEQLIYRVKKTAQYYAPTFVKVKTICLITQNVELVEIAKKCGIDYSVYNTEKRDVLAEFAKANEVFKCDVVVRITGDCPCTSPRMIEQMICAFVDSNSDIICNNSDALKVEHGIDGLDIEVFSASALRQAYETATEPYDREHCCPWMYKNLKSEVVPFIWELSKDLKLSIDWQEDYERICDIFKTLGNDFEIRDLVSYFKEKEKNEAD